jgi:hypothetical protein
MNTLGICYWIRYFFWNVVMMEYKLSLLIAVRYDNIKLIHPCVTFDICIIRHFRLYFLQKILECITTNRFKQSDIVEYWFE